jgi:prepilin-type processing-associated H-X9-DG protein
MKLPHGNTSHALTKIEILFIVAPITLLIGVAVVWIFQARNRGRSTCCNCNLKQVGLASRLWESDHESKFPTQVSVANGGVMELVTNGDVFPVFQAMSNELVSPIILVCPSDTARSPAKSFITNFNDSKISYFASLDANETMPQTFLSGDRNITNGVPPHHDILELKTNQAVGWTKTIHNARGNVGLADGSVQIMSNSGLTEALQNSEMATNRIVLP